MSISLKSLLFRNESSVKNLKAPNSCRSTIPDDGAEDFNKSFFTSVNILYLGSSLKRELLIIF